MPTDTRITLGNSNQPACQWPVDSRVLRKFDTAGKFRDQVAMSRANFEWRVLELGVSVSQASMR
jgi:hypothetical protein